MAAVAEVDPIAGTITLPLDRYRLTLDETATLISARSLAINLCARSEGINGSWAPTPPNNFGDRRYGVWVLETVQKYGYDLPPSNVTAETNAVDGANATYEACNSSDPDAALFNYDSIAPAFDTVAELSGLSDAALESSEAQTVFSDWEACLEANGLQRDTEMSPFAVAGAGLEPTSENISIALKDVSCKDEVEFIQRLADNQATYEQPIVDKYSQELTQARSEYDDMLAVAAQYLANNAP